METPSNSTLIKLSDTDLTLGNPADDIRGRKVLDSAGEEIGHIDDLIIDTREKKVRFLRLTAGGFLGMGAQKFLIPADAITRVEKSTVHISRTREHVAASPVYDPEVLFDENRALNVYGYWGYSPFWASGYVSPNWPFYM